MAIDELFRKDIKDTLHQARVTLTQLHIIQGICASLPGTEAAMTNGAKLINKQIMIFNKVNITSKDINEAVWAYATKVTAGKPLAPKQLVKK